MKRLSFEKHKGIYSEGDWFEVINKKGEMIGIIKWEESWKRHSFTTSGDFIHSYGCLQEIADFMKSLGGKP